MTLNGIKSLQQLQEIVREGLQSEHFELMDGRRRVLTEVEFERMARMQACVVEVVHEPPR